MTQGRQSGAAVVAQDADQKVSRLRLDPPWAAAPLSASLLGSREGGCCFEADVWHMDAGRSPA